MKPTLRLYDGYAILPDTGESGTTFLMPEVRELQAALASAGLNVGVDGLFGEATEATVRQWQGSQGLITDGIVGPRTWRSLDPFMESVPVSPRLHLLEDFHGDLTWVHEQEGHRGSPCWPGGQSGVTFDPGIDLAHQTRETVFELYEDCLTGEQIDCVGRVIGVRGDAAGRVIMREPILGTILISRTKALEVMPVIAQRYWQGVCSRFPSLTEASTPGSVQTALLSLAYNRGAGNSGLDVLERPLTLGDWFRVASLIGSMQQDHRLRGIRRRRRREAELILDEIDG